MRYGHPMIRRTAPELQPIVDAIQSRRRFVISSHTRPDGDAIGSQLAMAYALHDLGKSVGVVNCDKAPGPLQAFPGVPAIEIADSVSADFDAAIIMECGELTRTGVAGLDRAFVINIDHHPGNREYGQLNWFDPSAAACGEMVFDIIQALGVRISVEIGTHIYLAILTDTGGFHFSNISPRTFDICRQTLEAGVDPVLVSRTVFDSNSMARLRLYAAVLGAMRVDPSGRIVMLYLDQAMMKEANGTSDDIDGLINEPLSVKEVEAVAFFKHIESDQFRVSLRSKSSVDIGSVAKEFGGGGHRNAAGCTVRGSLGVLQEVFRQRIDQAISLHDGRTAGR